MVGIKGRSGRRGGSLVGGESIHVRLPPSLMRKVETLAAKDGLTVSEWMRRCILAFVTGYDTTMRQSLERAVEPYLATIGEAFGEALEKAVSQDPQLPRKMENALNSGVKDWLQKLASEKIIRPESQNQNRRRQ